MLKTILTSLLIGTALIGTSQASTIPQIHAATYELYEDGHPVCSGTFVKPQEFLTASHCYDKDVINKDPKLSVLHTFYVMQKDVKVTLVLNKINLDFDTSTLVVKGSDIKFPTVDVAKKYIPKAGDPVLLSSFPQVEGINYITTGLMTGEVPTPPGLTAKFSYAAGVLLAPGSSGGGLYVQNSKGGWELIGTAQATFISFPWLSLFSVDRGVLAVL